MTAPQADSRRRALIFAGVGAGLIALVLLASVLAGGGGGGGTDDSASPPATTGVPGTTTTTSTPPEGLVETFELFTTKNPFSPLVGPTAGAGGTPPAGGTGGTGTGTTGTGGTGTGTTGTGGTGTTGGGSNTGGVSGGAEPRRSQRVALVDIFTEAGKVRASVRVNDSVFRVSEGETFASNFRVLSLDNASKCGRFIFGDDPFRLCEGDEILK